MSLPKGVRRHSAKVIMTDEVVVDHLEFKMCERMLKDARFEVTTFVNRSAAVQLGGGRISPVDGFVIHVEGMPRALVGYRALFRWIDSLGLFPLTEI
ncbi:hypothetical protein [Paraburkholderia sp. BCC1886]|uniref:hypothetical protein n=1 Tax=Paraburkholderia sp. BCC1886 TaxID=2562670 RepID=UPI001182F818|nr:hypothetical protein [Paraburkholderia sp. BCC1886]